MSQHFYAFLAHMNHWHWGLFAVGLTLMEWVAPRSVFLWLGLSAGVVSALLFLLPTLGWPVAWVLFIVIAVLAAGLARIRMPRRRAPTAVRLPVVPPNRRASQYVGRLFTLSQPIHNGVGLLQIDNTLWTIYGLDMAAGTSVKVVGFEGSILSVEAMEQQEESPVE
ncbi:MAG: NfeD family protein [Magnetococcales bacterium]|nr:NfeD family protein [Magnetococcales bacterium]